MAVRALFFAVSALALPLSVAGCASGTGGAGGAAAATVVADNPRIRQWDQPLAADCLSGRVKLQVDGCGGRRDRFAVPAGRVTVQAVFEDTRDTVPDRRLTTCPVAFPLDVQCGREYRIRGLAFHRPCAPNARPTDPSAYRVVLAAQDMSTGQIVKKVDVDPRNNRWKDTSTDLLTDLTRSASDQ